MTRAELATVSLTLEQEVSPMVCRPNDLRHSGVIARMARRRLSFCLSSASTGFAKISFGYGTDQMNPRVGACQHGDRPPGHRQARRFPVAFERGNGKRRNSPCPLTLAWRRVL